MTDGADGWVPEFPGQRPPFTGGNEAAVTHGAHSERRVGPLAEQIARELLADPDTPPHVREPVFAAAVTAWARTEAVVRLLWAWLEERDILAALTDLTTEQEEQETRKGSATRKTTIRHIGSVLDTLRRYETLAASQRGKLGLDPASAARLGRDLAARRYLDANATPLAAALTAIEENRRAITGGEDG